MSFGGDNPWQRRAEHPNEAIGSAPSWGPTPANPPSTWPPQDYLPSTGTAHLAGRPGRRTARLLAGTVALVLVAAIVAVVAVRSRASKPNPVALIGAAPAATQAGGSAHFTSTVSITGAGGQNIVESGDANFQTKASQVELSLFGFIENIRLVNGVGYIQFPPIVPLPNGAHWVEISPSDVGASGATSSLAGDPTQGLQFLGGLIGRPTVVGRDTINGVATTHYHVAMDLQTLFQHIGTAESHLSPLFAQAFQQLAKGANLSSVPGDVWLDSQGRVRRLAYSFTISSTSGSVTETESTDFSNFGEPVNVSPPAANDTAPFSALKNILGNLPGGSTA